ncbi:MAG: acyl carrier protein [Saccharofermentans sp.]|nr:acyl carrier protein [Saccharofermentans sp.]
MSNEELFEKLKGMIVDQLGVDEDSITMESSFVDDLNADSLDMVELVMAMEQEFDISVPDEVAEKVGTVGDAVEFIKNALG